MLSNSELNEIFDAFFNSRGRNNVQWKTSVVKNNSAEDNYEINQTEDGAYLFFEASGFNKSCLNVEMENGILYINGKRTYKLNGDEKVKTISKEFQIGKEYDANQIEATIEDGLLTVFVPNFKKVEKRKINLL